jgi:hypothetical protein
MKEPKKIIFALNSSILVYVIIITSFSGTAYYCFGDGINDMVTLNLPHDRLTASL